MPLIKSASDKAVGENIKTEMDAGKPHKQAVAIALDVQRRAKKEAKTEDPRQAEQADYVSAWKED